MLACSLPTWRDVMTRDVVSVPDTATIDRVRALLVSQRLKRVPVVDGKGHIVTAATIAGHYLPRSLLLPGIRIGNKLRGGPSH